MNSSEVLAPAELALQKEYKLGGVISRNDVYQQAEQAQYNSGQQIKFYLPSNVSDLREHTMQFRINGTAFGAPATFTRFGAGISCIFQRLEVLLGPTKIMDIENIDVLKTIIRYCKPVAYTEGSGAILEGTSATLATRNADFLDATRVYAVNFDIGILKRVLYLDKLNVQFIIRLTLNQPNRCLETDNVGGTPGDYQVLDPEFHYAALVMSPQWNQRYNEVVNKFNGYKYTYRTYMNFQNTNALAAGVTNAQLVLPFRYSSLVSVMYVMRNAADLNNPLILGKNTVFNFNAITSARLKVDNVYYPVDASRSVQDIYSEFLDSEDLDYYCDVFIATNYRTTTFVRATPLMKHPKDNRDIYGSINGLNTASSGTSIVSEIRTGAPIAATQQLDVFARFEAEVTFLPNGSVTYVE